MIHIVMPFHRSHLMSTLINIFGKERLRPIILKNQNIKWSSEWPAPIIISDPVNPKDDLCYYKLNQFIKTQKIIDEDYYWCMCDDDSIEPNVIPSIEKMKDDIIFISMKRGDNLVMEGLPQPSWHPTNTLFASPENAQPYCIGLEQMVIKGKIFKTLQYDVERNIADGLIGQYLAKTYKIRYEPELFVLFNWFQEGRWNK